MDAQTAARIAQEKWERAEARAEARMDELMKKLVAKHGKRLQAGTPATTMSPSDKARDTSQTPSDGE